MSAGFKGLIMNEKQKNGMIRFHALAEQAYIKYGKNEQAKQARKMRENLEKLDFVVKDE